MNWLSLISFLRVILPAILAMWGGGNAVQVVQNASANGVSATTTNDLLMSILPILGAVVSFFASKFLPGQVGISDDVMAAINALLAYAKARSPETFLPMANAFLKLISDFTAVKDPAMALALQDVVNRVNAKHTVAPPVVFPSSAAPPAVTVIK